jgi:hypothetical protein
LDARPASHRIAVLARSVGRVSSRTVTLYIGDSGYMHIRGTAAPWASCRPAIHTK